MLRRQSVKLHVMSKNYFRTVTLQLIKQNNPQSYYDNIVLSYINSVFGGDYYRISPYIERWNIISQIQSQEDMQSEILYLPKGATEFEVKEMYMNMYGRKDLEIIEIVKMPKIQKNS